MEQSIHESLLDNELGIDKQYEPKKFGLLKREPQRNDRYIQNSLRAIGVTSSVLYFVTMGIIDEFNFLYLFSSFIILGLFIQGSPTFTKFWLPFVVLWMCYNTIRLISNILPFPIFIEDIYKMELKLTGRFTNGRVPAFIFQKYRAEHSNDPIVVILDIITALFYMSHIIAPVILGILFYRNHRNEVETKRFVFTFISVSISGFITFVLFPVAPPWYIWNEGQQFNFKSPNRETSTKDPGGLISIDKLIGIPFFTNVYGSINSSAYAAFPSLHNAYAIIVAIFVYRVYGRKASMILIYPLGMAFASMWLNHHYVIDIIGSLAYVAFFNCLGRKLIVPNEDMKISNSILEPYYERMGINILDLTSQLDKN